MFCLPISTFLYLWADSYLPSIGLPILLKPNRQIDPWNIQARRGCAVSFLGFRYSARVLIMVYSPRKTPKLSVCGFVHVWSDESWKALEERCWVGGIIVFLRVELVYSVYIVHHTAIPKVSLQKSATLFKFILSHFKNISPPSLCRQHTDNARFGLIFYREYNQFSKRYSLVRYPAMRENHSTDKLHAALN
jgi:hypothetical protein